MNDEERKALLAEIKGIRVTDWHDALDALGLFDRGLMSPDIRPLWRDFETFSHCISGFAFTVRVVPSSNAIVARDVEDYRRQEGEWYAAELRWSDELTPGDLVVVDARVSRDCGLIGSQNSLQWLAKGAVGIVSSGGARRFMNSWASSPTSRSGMRRNRGLSGRSCGRSAARAPGPPTASRSR